MSFPIKIKSIAKTYILRATHYNEVQGELIERQIFERTFHIGHIQKVEASYYNPDLRMNFYDERNSGFAVTIHMDDFQLSLSRRLKQSEDFIRRINYLFDKIVFKINQNGKILTVMNTNEIKAEWKKLKLYLLADYIGSEVRDYLHEVDKRLCSEQSILENVMQYFHFGLLFPEIANSPSNSGLQKRLVRLSEYESDLIEETAVLVKQQDGIHQYQLKGKSLSDSQFSLLKYEGWIELNDKGVNAQNAYVEIDYQWKNKIIRWIFDLQRQNENM